MKYDGANRNYAANHVMSSHIRAIYKKGRIKDIARGQHMYRITRTSTICVAAMVALILSIINTNILKDFGNVGGCIRWM